MLGDLIRDNSWVNRDRIPALIAASFPVFLESIGDGARYGLNRACFPEPRPRIAYSDDDRCELDDLRGLRVVGRVTVPRPPATWPRPVPDAVVLELDPEGPDPARFHVCAVGEFSLEIYHARPDGSYVTLERDSFCFK